MDAEVFRAILSCDKRGRGRGSQENRLKIDLPFLFRQYPELRAFTMAAKALVQDAENGQLRIPVEQHRGRDGGAHGEQAAGRLVDGEPGQVRYQDAL